MANVQYHMQLKSALSGVPITASGGTVFVATAGLTSKATLYDKNGAALTNPIQMTNGSIDFFVADTVASVDLYIMTPGGHFLTKAGIVPSGPNEILVETTQRRQVMKIPFAAADQGGDATETDTGFDIPNPSIILNRLHGCGLYMTVLHAAKTMDVGTGEVHPAESGGDANGLIAASAISALGLVTGTDGALFSTNAPYKSDAQTAKSITYTLSTGTTTAAGFIILPYELV